MDCAFNTKDCRVIPMTEEVSRNLTYFGISAKLAIAIESGKIDKEKVRTAIIADVSPETLLQKAVPAPVVEEPVLPVLPPADTDNDDNNTDLPPADGDTDNPFKMTADGFSAMKVLDLKAYAKENGIALKASDSKEDIVATIVASIQE